MLFLNVYKIKDLGGIDLGYIGYAMVSLTVIFLLAIPAVMSVTKKRGCRGVLLQSVFRSNYALLGIPLSRSLFGVEGEAVATLLSAILIPVFNVLAVVSMSIFSDNGQGVSLRKIIIGIV